MAHLCPWTQPVTINGYEAVVELNSVTGIYRSEFTGPERWGILYATNEEQMRKEGKQALSMFLCLGAGWRIVSRESE
ncbi:hypothetical protein PUN4_180066 [Paraburkholderia unamae]|nr:hypothetical protein PUN4_180066 [Paraburkholderia unamae]